MITYDHKFACSLFYDLLTEKQTDYLETLVEKANELEREIADANSKKEQIITKIKNNSTSLSPSSKEVREYINSSEFSCECIENLLNNFSHLHLKYTNIRKYLATILESHNLESDKNLLNEDLNILSEKISDAIYYEELIQTDNQKCNLLIDNFLNNLDENENEETSKSTLAYEEIQDNLVLRVSEKNHIVELPYTKLEIEKFLKQYPNDYKTPQDVIDKEFTGTYAMYNKHPIIARFREAYYLSRNKEMKSILDSFNYAKSLMFKRELNPTIIAAVKSEDQLQDYINCLENDKLEDFSHFTIIFEINPI